MNDSIVVFRTSEIRVQVYLQASIPGRKTVISVDKNHPFNPTVFFFLVGACLAIIIVLFWANN